MLKCVEIEPVWPRQDRLKYLQRSTSFSKSNSFRLQKCVSRGEQELAVRGPIGQSEQKQKRSVCLFLLTFSHFFPLVAAAAEKQHREEEQNQRAAASKSSLWKSPSIVAGGRENRKALPVWKVWFGAFLFRFVVIVLGVCGTE